MKAARTTFLRQRNGGVGSAPDRTSVVALLCGDLLGGAEPAMTEGEDVLPVEAPSKGRHEAGSA